MPFQRVEVPSANGRSGKGKMIEWVWDFVLQTFSAHRLLGDMKELYKNALEKDQSSW